MPHFAALAEVEYLDASTAVVEDRGVRILHLTDLHADGERHNKLILGWSGVPAQVTSQLDAIIISGDIANVATRKEYEQALAFVRKKLLPLVNGDVSRIIVVPGNHDVSWSEPSPDEYLSDRGEEWARRTIRKADKVTYRFVVPDKYYLRFNNFFKHFYCPLYSAPRASSVRPVDERATKSFDRRFPQTMAPGEDWSLHCFPDHRVAIVGFNSISEIDKYNPNYAEISEKTIDAAATAIAQDGMKWCSHVVAVWHHGLYAERGRSDAISETTLRNLYRAGFRVFFHGHTHKDQAAIVDDLYGQRVMALGTGSFGAVSTERPGGVANELRLVTLRMPSATSLTFELIGRGWSQRGARQLFLSPMSAGTEGSYAQRHQRTVTMQADGVITTACEFQDVTLSDEFVIAYLKPPFGNTTFTRARAHGGGNVPATEPTKQPDGHKIALRGHGQYELVDWSYRATCMVACSKRDLELLRASTPHGRHSEISHKVRSPVAELVLVVRGLQDVATAHTTETFSNVAATPRTSQPQSITVSDELRYAIRAPRVGARYAIHVTFKDTPVHVTSADELSTDLVRRCRDETHAYCPVSTHLAAQFSRVVHEAGIELPERWMIHLLDRNTGDVEPAFGRLSFRNWGQTFRYGEGLVGASVRAARTMSWTAERWGRVTDIVDELGSSHEDEIFYRPMLRHRSHDAILQVPILSTSRHAIGTFGISAQRGTPAATAIASLCSQDPVSLAKQITRSFWQAIHGSAPLPGVSLDPRAIATRALEECRRQTGSVET